MATAIPEPTDAVVTEEAVQTEEASPLAGHQITEEDAELARQAMSSDDEETTTEEPVVEEVPAADDTEEAPEAPEDTPEAEDNLIDIATLGEEFSSPEGPSDETRQALIDALGTKFANPEAIIDQFVAGTHATNAAVQQEAYALAGGEESYIAMTQWAASNLDEGSRAAYNEAILNPSMAPMAIKGLHAQFALATGQGTTEYSPQRVSPAANVGSGVSPVTSTEQIAELTADPRFDRDPAFRAQVEARIKAGMNL